MSRTSSPGLNAGRRLRRAAAWLGAAVVWAVSGPVLAQAEVPAAADLDTARVLHAADVFGAVNVERGGASRALRPGFLLFARDRVTLPSQGRVDFGLARHGEIAFVPAGDSSASLVLEKLPVSSWAQDLETQLRLDAGVLRVRWLRPGEAGEWPLTLKLDRWTARPGHGETLFRRTATDISACAVSGSLQVSDGASERRAIAAGRCLSWRGTEPPVESALEPAGWSEIRITAPLPPRTPVAAEVHPLRRAPMDRESRRQPVVAPPPSTPVPDPSPAVAEHAAAIPSPPPADARSVPPRAGRASEPAEVPPARADAPMEPVRAAIVESSPGAVAPVAAARPSVGAAGGSSTLQSSAGAVMPAAESSPAAKPATRPDLPPAKNEPAPAIAPIPPTSKVLSSPGAKLPESAPVETAARKRESAPPVSDAASVSRSATAADHEPVSLARTNSKPDSGAASRVEVSAAPGTARGPEPTTSRIPTADPVTAPAPAARVPTERAATTGTAGARGRSRAPVESSPGATLPPGQAAATTATTATMTAPAAASPVSLAPAASGVADGKNMVSDGPEWIVNVVTVSDPDSARDHVERLTEAGFPAQVRTDVVRGRTSYRVVIASIPNEEGARRVADLISSRLGYRTAWPLQKH